MKKKALYISLITILLLDLSYSFLQHYYAPLDGDMAGGIIPATDVQEIFNDPFGFNVILENNKHPNPNRFFAHLFFRDYFRYIPIFFQKIMSPIQSVYFSCALVKILIHLAILYLLSVFILPKKTFFSIERITVLVLLSPLLQTYGFNRNMGIIDNSITYTFFYALPITILLFFLAQFHYLLNKVADSRLSFFSKLIAAIAVIILPLNGPLIPPIILILSSLLCFYYFHKFYGNTENETVIKKLKMVYTNIPKDLLLFFIPITLLSIYSLILGSYNSTYPVVIPLLERYMRLPKGFYEIFILKLNFPVLFSFIALNIYIIKKHFNSDAGKKIIVSVKWISLFSIIYLLLLPIGGYRPYRPNILRYDTAIPITICLIYLFGVSSYFLIRNIKQQKWIYASLIAAFWLFFTNADILPLARNACQKKALNEIIQSEQQTVKLQNNCGVLSWGVIHDPQKSAMNAKLLKLWRITPNEKLYYYPSP